jgi:malate dehydrogenase (oxaloacetate-decarboxylating)(NADP+)
MSIRKQDALRYHASGRPGKLEISLTKPCATQLDLSLAYTPGVAEVCREIEAKPEEVFRYTSRGNLVAVVSNGTAVLGLGDIGPAAGKPVMEGKAVLFKRFADIDVFDIELAARDPDDVIRVVRALEPTFGGINLEDIKAPDCFYIEEKLRREMSIPVFHDDQHGTAIISAAALLNALELAGKAIENARIVINGAGAAGIACAQHYMRFGARRENLILCDSQGVIFRGRQAGMNPYKEEFASETSARTLEEAMSGADVFVGLSVADIVSQAMVRSMNRDPIVFALANPDPEIAYELALEARPDIILATGRSDYPNQVNNVLGFPFIFRGALDVRARTVNDAMEMAATRALAELAKEGVPDTVLRAYGRESMQFGRDYIIPKPFDSRVLLRVAPAVARAAMESGVAGLVIDLGAYVEQLEKRLGLTSEVMRVVFHKAARNPKRVVFPEGDQPKILRASQLILENKIGVPMLLGSEVKILDLARRLEVDLRGARIVDPGRFEKLELYTQELYALRQRDGVTLSEARRLILDRNYFGPMMVRMGDGDALISGLTQHYPATIRPALEVIKVRDGFHKVSGLYLMLVRGSVYFFADTTVNIEPDAHDLAEIALSAAEMARRFNIEPRVAMLSFSNFGSTRHPLARKVRRAVEIVRELAPDLVIDGEMQADTAVVPEILQETYPFSALRGGANVLVFPDLQAGNIAYKLMARIGGAEAIGPILMGMRKPVHVLQRGAEVHDIVNMAAIAVVDASECEASARASCVVRAS